MGPQFFNLHVFCRSKAFLSFNLLEPRKHQLQGTINTLVEEGRGEGFFLFQKTGHFSLIIPFICPWGLSCNIRVLKSPLEQAIQQQLVIEPQGGLISLILKCTVAYPALRQMRQLPHLFLAL